MKKSLLLLLSLAFSLSGAALLTGCGSTSDSSTTDSSTSDNSVSVECQHVWEETTAKVEAECGKAGSEAVFTCDACGETKGGEEIAALEHDWEETTAKVEAECGKAGSEAVFTCDTCGETKGGEEIAALEHDWEETTAKVEAECGKAGSEAVYTCANGCGETKGGEEIAALEHDWQETTAKVEAECEKAGSEAVYTCANGCGETKGGEEIPATNHAWTAVAAKAATCTADGYIAHWDCDNCDAIATGEAGSQVKVEASAIVTPASHTIVTAEAQTATCTQAGWETYQYCTECDYTEKEEFFGDHTFVDGVCSNSECGMLIEETYLKYDGSLDGIAYADGKWTVTAEAGKVLHFSAEAIQSYVNQNADELVFTFTSKDNQESGFNVPYNGNNEGNMTAKVVVKITDEIKANGLDMRVYYSTLGWTAGKDASDGFVVSVADVKSTWFLYNGSADGITYDGATGSWMFTVPTAQVLHLDAAALAKYAAEGAVSLTLEISAKPNQYTWFRLNGADNANQSLSYSIAITETLCANGWDALVECVELTAWNPVEQTDGFIIKITAVK